MTNYKHNRFERGILKIIALIGLIRFIIALILSEPANSGNSDFYLDLTTAIVFLGGVLLVQFRADNKWVISLFFAPLILLLWVNFYFNNGLASAGEINAYAIAIILSLTIRGKLLWIFIGIFLVGVFVVLYFVEQQNLLALDLLVINSSTTTLLVVTMTNIWITFHAKNVFDTKRTELNNTNSQLIEQTNQIKENKKELNKQNEELLKLKNELEQKVAERTNKLQKQKKAIEEYMQLTLTDLVQPYEQTLKAIQNLESLKGQEMADMMIGAGENLKIEVEKLKDKLVKAK